MEKIVQCNYCRNEVSIEEAFYEIKEAPIYNPKTDEFVEDKIYYHYKCYELVQQDYIDRNNLFQTIKKIHNINTIPPFFYTKILEELKKNQGYTYKSLEKAYKLAAKKITDGIKYRNIKDKVLQLNYGYKAASNYIELSSKGVKIKEGG